MMADTSEAKNKLASQRQQGAQPQEGDASVAGLVAQMKPQIERALPRAMDADRFARMVLTTLRTNPALADCDGQSLLAACMLSAQLGLEPGPLGHAYYVPFRNKGRLEVTFILGYRGMLELARRSGEIASIEAREVRANDLFQVEFGLDPTLRHSPAMDGDRGEPTHYYGIAKFADGGHYFEVLSRQDVDGYRERSKASDNGPWVTDFSAMARKTVIRRMAPYLPLSAEAARAVASDEGVVARLDELSHDGEVGVSHDDPVVVETVRDQPDDDPDDQPDDDPDDGVDPGEHPDQLRKPQLQRRLHQAGLDTTGKVDELRARWKEHLDAGQPDPASEPDDVPAGGEGNGAAPEPAAPPAGQEFPSWINPDTGQPWTWRDHAEARQVMVLPIIQTVAERLDTERARPNNSAGLDQLAQDENDEAMIHDVIDELAS